MEDLDDLLDPGVREGGNTNGGFNDKLPNANATLVLGIISIVGCFLYGLPGLICGIIALAIHKKDKTIYKSDPGRYEQSFKNSKAGFICAIIGTSLSGLYFLFWVWFLVFAIGAMSTLHI